MDNMLNNKDKLEIKFKELLTENTLLKNKITQLELENERLLKQLQEINVWSKKLYSKQSLL